MKNIFKFMGIALMATSLLVACKNDPEEEDPIDTNPVVNPNPTPQQGTLEITWNGQAQEIGDIRAIADNSVMTVNNQPAYVLSIDACKGVDDEGYVIYPEFIAAFADMAGQIKIGPQVSMVIEYNDGTKEQGTLNDVIATEVFETAGIQIGQNLIGDYQVYGLNAAPMFSAFDATALTLNGEVNYKFMSMGDYIAALQSFSFDTTGMAAQLANNDSTIYNAYRQAVNEAYQNAENNATKKDMLMKINNYIFTAGKI